MSRVGAREKDERLRSPDFQRQLIRGAFSGEYELIEYPAELDVSGGKPTREVLDQIIGDIEAGELDGLAVAKLDRLSRLRPKDRVELIDRIEGAGGVIRSASENLDTSTPEGRFARDVFFGVARMQLEKYAEGFDMAKRNAIAEGIAIKRDAPYGFDFDANHRLRVVEREARVVRELFERRAAGASFGALQEWLAKRAGRRVQRSTIRYYLRNPVYKGELHFGDLVNTSPGFPAIVEPELWEAVERVNASRSAGAGVAVGRAKSLLAGIARCKGCNATMPCARSSHGIRWYKCPNDAKVCNAKARIRADQLEEYVLAEVLEWVGAAADETVEVDIEVTPERERIEARERLERAEAALIEYEADVELELEIGRDAYRAGRRARVELIEQRGRELDQLGEASDIETARTTLRAELTGSGELDTSERRALLAVVLEAVIVRKTPYRGAPAHKRARVRFRL